MKDKKYKFYETHYEFEKSEDFKTCFKNSINLKDKVNKIMV